MNDQVDHSRRRLLTAATVGTGAIGVAFAAVPFLASWQPSARAKALGAPVEVDASKLEAGQMLKVVWRGQAVFVVRRAQGIVDQLGRPRCDAGRSRSPTIRRSPLTLNRAAPRARAIPSTGWAWRCARISDARRWVRSSRTIRFRWRAPISVRTGPAASIARATARNTICRAVCSRACRHRRISPFRRTRSRARTRIVIGVDDAPKTV